VTDYPRTSTDPRVRKGKAAEAAITFVATSRRAGALRPLPFADAGSSMFAE